MRLYRVLLAALVIGAGALFGASAALAQAAANDPCAKMGVNLQARMKLIEQVQAFKDKKPTAQEACSAFTKLSSANQVALQSLEHDGAWCRAPETFAASLKEQQGQIDQAKANACKAAADMKKMQQQQQQQGAAGGRGPQTGPLGGTGDVLGGPQKLPQGAL